MDILLNKPPMPTPDTVADIIDGARDTLMVHGWVQGKPSTQEGQRCIVGAIAHSAAQLAHAKAQGGSVTFGTSCYAINAVLQHLGLGKPEHLPHWNDASERVFDEVADALEVTSKKVRTGDIVPQ